MSDEPHQRPRWVAWLLVVLPLWLLLSGAGAIWYSKHSEKDKEREKQQFFARSVSQSAIQDDVNKIVDIIGERNEASPDASNNLTRMAAMIEGALGPSNMGFAVEKQRGPAEWPLLHVEINGTLADLSPVWVICSYDSRAGRKGVEANATGVAAVLAAAQALAGEKLRASVHFAFVPHANDPASPVAETAAILAERLSNSKYILNVEAMGGGEVLWLSSKDPAAAPLSLAQGLGLVHEHGIGPIGSYADLASNLFGSGLPAVRVSTRPPLTERDADTATPPAAVLAASSGRLVELIRRCANRP